MDFGTIFYIANAAIPLVLIFSALLMLLLVIPPDAELNNYRTSRKVIAYAYLIFGLFSGINAIMNGPNTTDSDMFIVAVITLIIGSFQSFLFTYTLITLIQPEFFTRHWLTTQLVPISSLSILSFSFLFFSVGYLQKVLFHLFLAFYLYQLVYYTVTFIKQYKLYRAAADNYFSGDEARRIRWVAVAFFSALSVGIMALTLIIFPTPVYDLVVAILCGLFYTYFLVKYINYPYIFHNVIIQKEESDTNADADKTLNNLSLLIEQWADSRGYTQPDITIVSLADALSTNRTYLSAHINSNMHMNFNAWINYMRIEDAKKLLKSENNLSVADISAGLGYADHSSFSRQFKKATGLSPIEWKKNS